MKEQIWGPVEIDVKLENEDIKMKNDIKFIDSIISWYEPNHKSK